MELNQINHFINIVECGSMSAASERYHISQSTLSYTVRQLENELGVKLFERIGRGLRLTGAGEVFYSGAVKLFEEYYALIRQAAAYGKDVQPVRIVSDVVDYGKESCRIYRTKHPDAELELKTVPDGNGVYKDLIRGTVDIIISTDCLETSRRKQGTDIISEMLLDEPLMIFTSSKHPFAKMKSVSIKDLSDQTLITQPLAYHYRQVQEEILESNKITFSDYLEYSETETCALYAQSGKGVMFIPESVRGYQLHGDNPFNNEKAAAVYVKEDACRRRIWMNMRSDRSEEAALKAFVAFCRRYSAFIYENHRLPGEEELLMQ